MVCAMTYPRAHTVNPYTSGIYHCVSRCVRRAWLCGTDAVSGRSFEHRKQWIERRLLELSKVFAVELWGYAVMSNHYHAVLKTQPQRAAAWTDEEVAARWLQICKVSDEVVRSRRHKAIVGNPERVAELRFRLGDLSWFMRYLNEPLARWANREDGCTGRFWQGRFHSETLLDEGAVLAAMAYVDLNPVRAGLTECAETAKYTGLVRRLEAEGSQDHGLGRLEELGLRLSDYVRLVQWMERGEQTNESTPKTGRLAQYTADGWGRRLKALKTHCRVQGAAPLLREFAQACGQRWFKGVGWAPSR